MLYCLSNVWFEERLIGLANKTAAPTPQTTAEKPARTVREWYPEVYRNGAVISTVLAVGLMMILNIRSVMTSTMWTWLAIVAVALLALSWWKGKELVAVRVLVRAVTWCAGAAGAVLALVMAGMTVWSVWNLVPAEYLMYMLAPYTAYAAAILFFAAVPLCGLIRAEKKMDIRWLRFCTTVGAVFLAFSCLFGGIVQWGFDNLYFKIFTCLIAGLAAAFSWMVKPQQA